MQKTTVVAAPTVWTEEKDILLIKCFKTMREDFQKISNVLQDGRFQPTVDEVERRIDEIIGDPHNDKADIRAEIRERDYFWEDLELRDELLENEEEKDCEEYDSSSSFDY